MPEVVERLLTEGWRDVMLLALLREGEDSEQWRQAVELAGRLVWSVQPKHEPTERQRLLKAIPELLSGLREGLNNISAPRRFEWNLPGNPCQIIRKIRNEEPEWTATRYCFLGWV